jgi:flagellar biosynthesis component FlhA
LASIEPGRHSVEDLVEMVVGKAACLLSLAGTASLLEELKGRASIYGEEMARLEIPTAFVHALLRLLLQERVCIQDLELILSAVIEGWQPKVKPDTLLASVRERMGDPLCESLAGPERELVAVTLAPRLEAGLKAKLSQEQTLDLEEAQSNRLLDLLHEVLSNLEEERPLLLVGRPLRLAVWRLVSRSFPALPVLSWGEVGADYGVNVVATLEQKL